ncbi:MAG TPA: winged helix-turn-helix domain-containing protein [Sphingomicrobium sp.]|nr:winged helix-turn-helix domain-containing protein [Sphingomicrobium sp.]
MDQVPIGRAQAIVLAHEPPFHIGAAEIRPATREFVNGGTPAVVEPRVMQLLVALHRAKGSVVSKDDLIGLCWDGRVVGEDAINRVVSRLRHDAVEKAGGAFRVETITKVGYRLVTDGPQRDGGTKWSGVSRRQAITGAAIVAAAGGSGLAWRAFRKPDWPPEARALHEQGMAELRDGTVDQYASAAAKFRREAEIAPDRAEPWAAMALAYRKQASMAPAVQRQTLHARSDAAAKRALAIDPTNGDALAAMAMRVPLFRNWEAYERAWRGVAQRAPDNPIINSAIATVFSSTGRSHEALAFLDRALAVDSSFVRLRVFRGSLLWDCGRIGEAEDAFESAFRLWPRNYSVWFSRFYFLAYNGRAAEALAMIADTAGRPIGIPDWNFAATEVQVRALANPTPTAVREATASALDFSRKGVGFGEQSTILTAALNQLDAAFTILNGYYFDRGFTLGDQRYSKEQGMYVGARERNTYFLFIPRTAQLRRDPRFKALTSELGLDAYWRATGSRPDYA